MNIPTDEIAHILKTAPVPVHERQRMAIHFSAQLKLRFGNDFDAGAFLAAYGFSLSEGGSGPGIAEMQRRMKEGK